MKRLAALRSGAGGHPVALASGVTPDNVHEYLPFAGAYLVASGIEESFGRLDPEKTCQLASLIRGYAACAAGEALA